MAANICRMIASAPRPFPRRYAALVLGAKVHAGGLPSDSLRRRALHAAALWHQGRVALIVASGGEAPHTPAEAVIIARLCQDAGVPRAALRLEEAALTTRQNIRLSRAILRAEKVDGVILVTDPYHAPRARLMAWQEGLRAGASCPRMRDVPMRQWLHHLPREGAALLAAAFRVI
jgi:uncharacterized SAM-binding protein YcdF (DUF218 family)